MVSVIWSVPRVEGVKRQAPTSASRSASAVCRADRFLKLGCLMGRLMSWRLFSALFLSNNALSRSSLVRMWYHLHSFPLIFLLLANLDKVAGTHAVRNPCFRFMAL